MKKIATLAALLIAVVVAIGGWFLWKYQFSPTAQIGIHAGFEPKTYVDVHDLQTKAAASHSLSANDVDALKIKADDANPFIRARALTALADSGKAESANAISIARAKLSDKEGVVRQYALRAMDKLDAPDIGDIAKKMLTDSEPFMRTKAKAILAARKIPPSL